MDAPLVRAATCYLCCAGAMLLKDYKRPADRHRVALVHFRVSYCALCCRTFGLLEDLG